MRLRWGRGNGCGGKTDEGRRGGRQEEDRADSGEGVVKEEEDQLEEDVQENVGEADIFVVEVDAVDCTGTVRRKCVDVDPTCSPEGCNSYEESAATTRPLDRC